MAITPTEYPRGPDRRYYFESMERVKSRHHPEISLIAPVIGTASDGLDRIGFGGTLSVPISDDYNLGVGYLNYPFTAERIINGHHFEAFLAVPDKLQWGEWRFGVFTDLSSFESWKDNEKNGGLAGAFAGLILPVYTFWKHASVGLMVEGGLGYVFGNKRMGTMLQGGGTAVWKF